MTNEKTESEIFEEQLNSLYKPIKQEKNTPESENKTNEANQNLANQGLERLASGNETNEPSYLSTGIAYLDNKIKNRTITAFDYYMAKKFLGLDLNVNLNGNLPKTNALKPLALAMGIQGETPLGGQCGIGVLESISCTKIRVML